MRRCTVHRFCVDEGHTGADPAAYRPKGELERWKTILKTGHDPRILTRPRTDFVDRAIKAGENN